MPKYLLLLHDDMDALARISPDEMQRVIADYAAWSELLAAQGRIHGGEKLRDEGGRHLTAAKGKTVVRDGPFAEAKDMSSNRRPIISFWRIMLFSLTTFCDILYYFKR